jgi:hypothetical protein
MMCQVDHLFYPMGDKNAFVIGDASRKGAACPDMTAVHPHFSHSRISNLALDEKYPS